MTVAILACGDASPARAVDSQAPPCERAPMVSFVYITLMMKWWGVILKGFLSNMLRALVSLRLQALAALLLSTMLSIADKRITRARWDGEDWEFKWSDGCLYWSSPIVRPKRVTSNIASFLTMHSPKPGDIILEVGAGNGTEVCSLSNMVGPSGRVIAIEADPTAVRQLKKQAKALRNQNVEVLGIAVGADEGEVQLDIVAPGGLENTTVATIGGTNVTVRSRPLRNILADLNLGEIAYMKMNIEGAEYDALVGLGSSIDAVREMCISCHDFTGIPAQRTFDKVREYLLSKGLRLSTLPPNSNAPWEDYYIFASHDADDLAAK